MSESRELLDPEEENHRPTDVPSGGNGPVKAVGWLADLLSGASSHGPSLDDLVASGDVGEPIPQGLYLELSNVVTTLKARREAMGLSLDDVSERSGLARHFISRLENGWDIRPALHSLYEYALALDAGITLGIEEIPPEET